MNRRKSDGELTILEAVDNLSAMAELDVASGEEPIHIEPGEETDKRQWLDPTHQEENREVVKQTFRVIRNYLQHVYDKDKEHLKDPETQKGIHAIMLLAGEAAQKVDKFTSIFKGAHEKEGVAHLKEYQDLKQFYMNKIIKKFQQALETEDAWQAKWGGVEEDYLDIQRRGLKDLETVRRDKEYELFYIHREDGRNFFNRNLLRHVKLVGDFDESITDPTGEDPFLRIKGIQDHDVHAFAKEVLREAASYLDEFFKEAMRHKDKKLVSALNKSIMALMLAANPRNLMQNTTTKNCLSYYTDFHTYFRAALSSEEYRKFLASPPTQSDYFSHAMLNLIHALCSYFFIRQPKRKETVELIRRLIQKGGRQKMSEGHGSAISIWNNLLDEDENIRNMLKHYPNGPLLKTLDAFREGSEQKGFDPVWQHNYPSQLYTFTFDDAHVSCLRIPSPTRQEHINKAEVIQEFQGFLRALNLRLNGEKHLLINLQDRTSWHEHARCVALEELQTQSAFTKSLIVITLPKNTEFYLQTASYQHLNQSDLFLKQFKEQIASAEECGFYFPPQVNKTEIAKFVDKALPMIHKTFFSEKNVLTRKNRLDFIEIFYQFFTMRLVQMLRPDSFSFTCKDAIDVGAAANAAFFAFLRLLSNDGKWLSEERDFLRWLLFSSALIVRERAIDLQRLNRTISALATMNAELEVQRQAVLKRCHELFGKPIFSQMKIEETPFN
jgi:hypothetical protein